MRLLAYIRVPACILTGGLVLIAAVGCASNNDPAPVRAPLTKLTRSRAHTVAPLLTIRGADLPEFKVSVHPIVEGLQDPREDEQFARCIHPSHAPSRSMTHGRQAKMAIEASSVNTTFRPQRPWASAGSERLLANSGYQKLGASSKVWIMPTPAAARGEIAFTKNVNFTCLEHVLRAAEAKKRERYPVQGVTIEPLATTVKGADDSFAFRTIVAYRGAPLVFYIDSMAFSYGQDMFTLSTFHASKPVPPAMDERLLGLLIARARSHSR